MGMKKFINDNGGGRVFIVCSLFFNDKPQCRHLHGQCGI